VPIAEPLREYGFSDHEIKVYEKYYGFREIRTDPGRSMADQLIAAGRGLPELAGQEHRVRYVLHARTMPIGSPYPINPVHQARDALGLRHAQAFSVSQHACASVLLSIELAGRLLIEDRDAQALALIFVGEKTFTRDARVLAATAVVGEGVAAILVRTGGSHDRLLGYASEMRGEFHHGTRLTAAENDRWTAAYADGVSKVITEALDRAGTRLDDIALILPHHVNRLSWIKVLRALQPSWKNRIYLDNLSVVGHCFGADPFINYCSARSTGRLRRGDRYVVTAVGLGATFSAMVFEH
jgi:3-oxoacyl-[acyl-carrier-protein] synthase-3